MGEIESHFFDVQKDAFFAQLHRLQEFDLAVRSEEEVGPECILPIGGVAKGACSPDLLLAFAVSQNPQ